MCILGLTGVAFAQQYQCPYMPMNPGKTWKYLSISQPDTFLSSIHDTVIINDRIYFAFALYDPQSQPSNIYWLRPEPTQIFALNRMDSSEYLLFDFDAQAGQSWDIPPDSSCFNVPINQCDWGSRVTMVNTMDTVHNPNRLFNGCRHFKHDQHPCSDEGIEITYFARDFGIVNFSQLTDGGVAEWNLVINKPDTILRIGIYTIVGNPCLTEPCLPGVVSAIEANDTVYVISKDDLWFWNGDFVWNNYTPLPGDSVNVRGMITSCTDIYGTEYFTMEVVDFEKNTSTGIERYHSKNIIHENILIRNYPNPLNGKTVIEYVVEDPGIVRLILFDCRGRTVRTLINEYQSSGSHKISFDGSSISSGVYFLQLSINGNSQTNILSIMK